MHATRARSHDQGIADVASVPARGEHATVAFLSHVDADLAEERQRLLDPESVQHPADQHARRTVEVCLADDAMRDVAAAAPAEQELGPERAAAAQEPDLPLGPERRGEDRRREPSSAAANDQHVGFVRNGLRHPDSVLKSDRRHSKDGRVSAPVWR